MPSGASRAHEAAEPPLLLLFLQRRLRGLGFGQTASLEPPGKDDDDDDDDDDGETEPKEDENEEDEASSAAPLFPSPPVPATGSRAMMATVLSHLYGGATGAEQALPRRRTSVNTTECVPVPSSEHVAEIVGRQGCKIKALRAKTNTYIKTPLRGEEPVFVVTGRKEDVAAARREILSAAEHFSLIRASRGRGAPGRPCCAPALPGQTTVQVRVPYRVVGLVVGPRGATIKRIQQQTHTYIVTPSRDKEPVFEVTGMPENVDRAREEIETHIAVRTGAFPELGDGSDFRSNGTDVGFEGGAPGPAWLGARPAPRARAASGFRNDSSSSLGSGSTDSYFGGGRLADFSPTSPFGGAGGFWFGEALPAVGAEEPAPEEPLPAPSPTVWAPFEPGAAPSGPGEAAGGAGAPRQGSRPPTPRLSPTFPEGPEHPLGRRARGDAPGSGRQPGPPVLIPAFSTGTNSYSSSNGGSASSSPPECQCRRRHDCVICFDGEATAALVPCGHNLFCLQCASRICDRAAPACPVCQAAVTQAIQIHS